MVYSATVADEPAVKAVAGGLARAVAQVVVEPAVHSDVAECLATVVAAPVDAYC